MSISPDVGIALECTSHKDPFFCLWNKNMWCSFVNIVISRMRGWKLLCTLKCIFKPYLDYPVRFNISPQSKFLDTQRHFPPRLHKHFFFFVIFFGLFSCCWWLWRWFSFEVIWYTFPFDLHFDAENATNNTLKTVT